MSSIPPAVPEGACAAGGDELPQRPPLDVRRQLQVGRPACAFTGPSPPCRPARCGAACSTRMPATLAGSSAGLSGVWRCALYSPPPPHSRAGQGFPGLAATGPLARCAALRPQVPRGRGDAGVAGARPGGSLPALDGGPGLVGRRSRHRRAAGGATVSPAASGLGARWGRARPGGAPAGRQLAPAPASAAARASPPHTPARVARPSLRLPTEGHAALAARRPGLSLLHGGPRAAAGMRAACAAAGPCRATIALCLVEGVEGTTPVWPTCRCPPAELLGGCHCSASGLQSQPAEPACRASLRCPPAVEPRACAPPLAGR